MNHLNWKENDIVLGQYRLIKKYESRQGIFWKAVDVIQNIPRGIKVSRDGFPGEAGLIKYARETYISLLVPGHPNLSKFYSSVVHQGNIVNIVEVVPGITLFDCYRDRQLSIEKKVAYIVQIIEALLHLNHTFGKYKNILQYESFYHGDLHPGNVIISEDDRAVLIDWGQAYRIREKSFLYPAAAPEFHISSPYKNYRGHKIDVFSLGVMVWNMFESGIPFGSGSYIDNPGFGLETVCDRRMNQARVLHEIDSHLYLTVKRMLRLNPGKRPNLESVLVYFRELHEKCNPDKRKNRFLYLKKRYSARKSEISAVANSLFETSKIIGKRHDKEKLKAKIFELSVRVITDNINLFSPGELEIIRRRYLTYLEEHGLWNDISEEKEIFEENFRDVSEQDIHSLFFRLNALVERYIEGENIEIIYSHFIRSYTNSRLKHYYYHILIEVIARFIADKGIPYHRLFKVLFYFYKRTKQKDFVFAFFHKFIRESKTKKKFNPVELQKLKLLCNFLARITAEVKDFNLEKSDYLLILIKFAEWGYTYTAAAAGGRNAQLKRYFYKLYCHHYDYIRKNARVIAEGPAWSGVLAHCLSFLLSYIQYQTRELSNREFRNAIDKISHLFRISKTRYLDFELAVHFKEVYLALRKNFKYRKDESNCEKLVLFSVKFSRVINDDFVRIANLLYAEKKPAKPEVETILAFIETKDFKSLSGKIGQLKLSRLSSRTIELYLRLKNGAEVELKAYKELENKLRSKGRRDIIGIAFFSYLAIAYLQRGCPDSYKELYDIVCGCQEEGISLYREDLFFHHILSLIDSGRHQEALKEVLSGLKDKEIVKENNMVRVVRWYYLLIEILVRQGSYYNAFIYLEELRGICPDLSAVVGTGRIGGIRKKVRFELFEKNLSSCSSCLCGEKQLNCYEI